MDQPEPHPPTLLTLELVRGAQRGESSSIERLYARYLPRLRWWAHGRLPGFARNGFDTEDVVQDAMMKTLRRLEDFDPQKAGCFQAYTRQAVLNAIRDHVRRARPHVTAERVLEFEAMPQKSPLEELIGRDAIERYEAALAELSPQEQELIVGRLELNCSFAELAEMTGRNSADAARVATKRALVRLAEGMGDGGT
jgi:RNA polymerase sigma-70 factor (ECF subfamily)